MRIQHGMTTRRRSGKKKNLQGVMICPGGRVRRIVLAPQRNKAGELHTRKDSSLNRAMKSLG